MLKILKYKHLYSILFLSLIILLNNTALFAAAVTLSWNPPTTNEDESPLIDLDGYIIYFGTESGNYSQSIDLGNVTTYQINDLAEGLTYYFAVTAYNTSGDESEYSNEIFKTIEPPAAYAPEITVTDSVSPADDLQISFGDITEGNPSDQTVTVTNNGNADLVIANIALDDPLAAPFSILNNYCSGQTIIPLSNCSFTVRFSPTTTGSFNDTFNISSNDTVILALSGTGTSSPVPDITVTDSAGSANDLQIPFGDLTEWRSQDQVVTITNNGSATLDIGNIAQNNPVEEPFSILNDNCSWQTLTPSGKCTFTVRFSPTTIGLFNDSFDIPSNDPDEDPAILTLSGTGLSSISNNPPSIPGLIYPANGQKGVETTIEFKWEKSTDPDGDPVTHYLYYSENTDFTNSVPITVASLENKDIYYAGIGSYGTGLLLFVIIPIFTGIARKRRKILLLTVMMIVAGMLLVSCGEVADVISDIVPFIDNSSSGSQTVSGLNTGTTYCWKVVAEDTSGEESESSVNCFETE